jgi:RES domain
MAGLYPTDAFAEAALDIAEARPEEQFGRIHQERYYDPLSFAKSRSRFSDPRTLPEDQRFGVLYLRSTLKVCFIEAVLRDRRNGAVRDYPIEEKELAWLRYTQIIVRSPLRLVDLREDGPLRMGIPSDVAGSSRQAPARQWSLAFHEHPKKPDGLIYPSRLNGDTNLAIYDRTIFKLVPGRRFTLIEAPGFADVLNALKVALI